ncbi:M56 family metallopeptidase [Arenibacter echinorum]|uniref:TonB family protein n=1 Tax=Arenibacter echinorum TaxID=440515 RepID=A0A327R6Z4_9FLAO|nr:M56 family metallopeptidase [Arenibacter echinorum]RAJ11353.1 TonB family protein [Arenibacter echinorum]
MIQYILECMAFQLLFLIIYDLFLKRETFFQWNRVYLIGTFVLSLLLPWIKIEAFKTTVSSEYFIYPEYLWGMDMSEGMVVATENSPSFDLSVTKIIFYTGMFIAAVLFVYKLYQIHQLKRHGEIRYFKDFTRVVVRNSNIAFSFFRSIFLGDQVLEKEHESIIQHELVHIEQRHTWDLLFFELMRIIGWFNPLVYVYQNRVSELHEFIADAKVAKTHKAEQYQLLLSQVFQTQHISFINQFFKSSLIKKRIVMLQKSKSKRVWQLKYLLLLPLVVGMLLYTSLEAKETISVEHEQTLDDASLIKEINEKIKSQVQEKGSIRAVHFAFTQSKNVYSDHIILSKNDYFESRILSKLYYKKMAEDSKGTMPDWTYKMADPTSATYDNYIRSKKAFQLLDENLNASIAAYKLYVMLLDNRDSFSEDYYLFEVKNTNVLTGNELRALNGKLEEISESGNSTMDNLIITDGLYDFLVLNNEKHENYIDPSINIQTNGLNIPPPNQDDVDVPFAEVERVPIFPGCEDTENMRDCFQKQMQKHIGKNFNYPEEAMEKGIQGRVNIMFVIQKDGSIGNVRMRSPDKILEAEAARIISLLPKMVPGEHNGEKVRVAYSVPITFKLEGKEEFGTSRNNDGSLDVPFAVIDKVPVFPGCEDAEDMRACFNQMLQRHIGKNFRYPEQAQEIGIQGRVNVLFIIQEDGSIGNVRLRGPDILLEDEAARIISLLPQMTPGEHRGEKVRVPFSIPITFKLQGPEENESPQSPELTYVSNTMSVMANVKKVGGKEYLRCMVTDGTKGLPGVNVSIQGKNETMVTDFDGIIEIEVQKGDVLIFQYKGLPTTMLTVTDQQKYHITNK